MGFPQRRKGAKKAGGVYRWVGYWIEEKLSQPSPGSDLDFAGETLGVLASWREIGKSSMGFPQWRKGAKKAGGIPWYVG